MTVDSEDSIIRLVHSTTQQYFERTPKEFFPDARLEIAEMCRTYLRYDAFDIGPFYNPGGFEDQLLN